MIPSSCLTPGTLAHPENFKQQETFSQTSDYSMFNKFWTNEHIATEGPWDPPAPSHIPMWTGEPQGRSHSCSICEVSSLPTLYRAKIRTVSYIFWYLRDLTCKKGSFTYLLNKLRCLWIVPQFVAELGSKLSSPALFFLVLFFRIPIDPNAKRIETPQKWGRECLQVRNVLNTYIQ